MNVTCRRSSCVCLNIVYIWRIDACCSVRFRKQLRLFGSRWKQHAYKTRFNIWFMFLKTGLKWSRRRVVLQFYRSVPRFLEKYQVGEGERRSRFAWPLCFFPRGRVYEAIPPISRYTAAYILHVHKKWTLRSHYIAEACNQILFQALLWSAHALLLRHWCDALAIFTQCAIIGNEHQTKRANGYIFTHLVFCCHHSLLTRVQFQHTHVELQIFFGGK